MYFTEVNEKQPIFLTDTKSGALVKIIAFIRENNGKICLGVDAPKTIGITKGTNDEHENQE